MEDSTTNDDFVKLLEMVNEKEEMIDEEFTEEELKTAFSPDQSPEPSEMDVSYDDDPAAHHHLAASNPGIQTETEINGNNCNGVDEMDNSSEVMVTTRATIDTATNSIAVRSVDADDEGGDSDASDFRYFSFQMMGHHITKGKHGKKLYKCDVCSAVYRHSFSLKRHFIRTHVNYAYLCETDVTNCGINLPASSSLRAWQSKSSLSSSSSSNVPVNEEGNNEEKSGEEESTDGDNKKCLKGLYCCHSCIMFFTRLSGLQNHVLVQHRNIESGSLEPAKIPCQQCNMSFIQRHNLMRHIALVHHCGNGKPSSGKTSKVNSKPIPERRTLERRRKVSRFIVDDDEEDDRDDEDDEDLFECHHCLAKFTVATDLLKHVESAHNLNKASKGRDRNHCSVFNSSYRDDARLEASFYRSLAQRISENLLYYVDGKPKANPVHHDVVTLQSQEKSNETKLNLIDYNFPSGFNHTDENELAKINFLLDVELKNCHSLEKFNLSTVTNPLDDGQDKAKHEKIFICNACGQSFASLSAFDLHEINNHPNIFCSFIEMDSDRNIPTTLLRWKNISPTGLLKICKVPQIEASTESSPSIKCTKCSRKFSHVSCLHEHILECASLSSNLQHASTEITSNQDDRLVSKESSLSSLSTATSPVSSQTNHSQTEPPNKQGSSPPSVSYNTRSAKKRNINNSSENFPNKKEKLMKNSRATEENVQDMETEDKKMNNKKDDNNNDCFVDSERNFQGKSESKDSHENPSSSSKRYTCTKCSKTFVYMAQLKNHYASCSNSKVQVKKKKGFLSILTKSLPNEKKMKFQVHHKIRTKQNQVNSMKEECNQVIDQQVNIHHSTHRSKSTEAKFKTRLKTRKESKKQITRQGDDVNITQKDYQSIELCKDEESSSNSRDKSKVKLQTDDHVQHQLTNEGDFDDAITYVVNAADADLMDIADANPEMHGELSVNESDKETSASLENSLNDGDSKSCREKMQRRKRDCSYRERRCPLCLRVFKYMANLKKHLQAGCRVPRGGNINPSDPVTKNNPDSNKADTDSSLILPTAKCEGKTVDPLDDVPKDEQKNDKDDTTDKIEEEAKSTNKDKTKLDLMRVKQDYPQYAFKGSPAQHHSCPYCQRGFTYLANFRRHTQDECPMRFHDAIKKQSILNESNMSNSIKSKGSSSSSKRSQDDDSSTKPSSDQAKQDEDLKASEERCKNTNNASNPEEGSAPGNPENIPGDITENKASNNSTKFRTFSCNICHKIYFSHLQMLKHHLSHKLDGPSSDSNRTNSEKAINSEKNKASESQLEDNESNGGPGGLDHPSLYVNVATIKFPNSLTKPLSIILESLARGGTEDRAG